MSEEWSVPIWAVLATLAVIALGIAVMLLIVRQAKRRSAQTVAQIQAATTLLQEQVREIERRLGAASSPRADSHEYTITMLGNQESVSEQAPIVPAPLFADLVLRESAVQAASFAAGLRRALAPETRNRIRFEMRREVKRARKQRRADLRQARRELQQRQRAQVDGSAA
ncbi:MAG: hypothetical protein WB767_15110 [Nocardioides sp.]